jgi:hypothetical protein
MSFDFFLQAIHDGDAATVDGAVVLDVLTRFSIEPVTPSTWWIPTAGEKHRSSGSRMRPAAS